MVVCVVIYALVGDTNFNLLLVAAVFCGLSQGSTGTLQNAIIAERIRPENRANVMAMVNALTYGGTIFYNIVGGKIAAANGGANWNHAYFLGFILIPTTILFAILLPKKHDEAAQESQPAGGEAQAQAPAESLGQSGTGMVYPVVLCLLYGVSMAFQYCTGLNMSNYFVNLLQLGDAALAGIVMSAGTLGVFVSGLLYKFYSKPLKNWVPVVGMFGYAVGSLLIAFIPNTAVFIVAQFIMGASTGCMTPYFVATISIRTPPKWVPVAMSLFMGFMNGFMFIAQYILDFLGKIGVDPANQVAYVGNKFAMAGYGLLICTIACVFLFPVYDKNINRNIAAIYSGMGIKDVQKDVLRFGARLFAGALLRFLTRCNRERLISRYAHGGIHGKRANRIKNPRMDFVHTGISNLPPEAVKSVL